MTVASARLSASVRRGVGFARDLARYGTRPALLGPGSTDATSYASLAELVEAEAERHALRVTEPLVLAIEPRLDDLVTYLACLAVGRPVLLTTPASAPTLEARFGAAPGAPAPHPDLALLMSTSGSTGSPRLVRLSASAVAANADAIADYLGLGPDDVGITALPLHYCYGLSVLHSHLAVGAAVVLSGAAVVDPCFWAAVDRHGVTSLAGVPHSFEMLQASGAADRLTRGEHPSVRLLTQAGGRMAPSAVRSWATRGAFDLVVMYGQTEATARMAYLPAHLAAARPDCIGVPVPGGALRLEPVEGRPDGVGELVYSGPNVMMGYAESREDLARGHELVELRTGDLGRQDADGLWRVVGRVSRFAKVLGRRVDLDRVEAGLAASGVEAWVVDGEDRLVVGAVSAPRDLAGRASRLAGLPEAALAVVPLREWPLLDSGKPDRQRLLALVEERAPLPADDAASVMAAVLRREVRPSDSFASLGGDSLSYVAVSVRLERLLGTLPDDWHLRPVGTLAGDRRPRPGWRSVETGTVLRALAMVAIVATHSNLIDLTGGAHLLLVLVGFNLGRFALASTRRNDRVRALVRTVARVAVPSVLWIGGVTLLTGQYPWASVLLLNSVLGPRSWTEPAWHFWFLEVLVLCSLALAALVAVPAVHRLDRRHPFWFPVWLALAGLPFRYDLVSLRAGDEIHRPEVLWWLLALGWVTARATTRTHRLVVSALLVLTLPGFFDDHARTAVVVLTGLLLVWVRRLAVPAVLVAPLAAVAGASLWIYLTHWQVYPHLEVDHPFLATAASLAVGVLAWDLATRVTTAIGRARDSRARDSRARDSRARDSRARDSRASDSPGSDLSGGPGPAAR